MSERSESIDRRSHIGHWASDTVTGAAHQHAIVHLLKAKADMQW
jgi:IS30 family transposase